jgi:hypothetical protein
LHTGTAGDNKYHLVLSSLTDGAGTEKGFAEIFSGQKRTVKECFKSFVSDRCIRPFANEIFEQAFAFRREHGKLEQYIDMQNLKPAEAILNDRLRGILARIKQNGTRKEEAACRTSNSQRKAAVQNVCQALEENKIAEREKFSIEFTFDI